MIGEYPEDHYNKQITIHPEIYWAAEDTDTPSIQTMIDAQVELLTDSSYGADADGNRGTPRTWITLITPLAMSIKIEGRHWMKVAKNDGEIRDLITEKEYSYLLDTIAEEVWEV